MKFYLKEILDPVSQHDGLRVLVGTRWPIGLAKKNAVINLWLPSLAPSEPLKVLCKDTTQWLEFKKQYKEELSLNRDVMQKIDSAFSNQDVITFVHANYGIEKHCALVLKEYFEELYFVPVTVREDVWMLKLGL